jgi:synaptojanin
MLKVLLTRLNEGFTTHGYLIEDLSVKKTLKTQTGVFRVNCLDSLDRTNVA